MQALDKQKLEKYLIEAIRLVLIILVIHILKGFFSSLPFVSELRVFNKNIYLSEFVSFLMSLIICFILYEFTKRTKKIVDEMLLQLPQAGFFHSHIVYLFLTIVLYFSAIDIFKGFIFEEWLWTYNCFFIGVSLFYISRILLVFYQNSHKISENIYNIIFVEILKNKKE